MGYPPSDDLGAETPVPSECGLDCAHFVSCCIGDETREQGGGLDVPNRTKAYGEPGADKLRKWLIDSGNAVYKTTIGELEVGDVIAYDWDSDGDSDHVALYIGNGNIAAHSASYWDEDWDIYNQSHPNFDYKFVHIFSETEDTTPPTLTITSPTDGTTVTTPSITVAGTASDASGIASVTVNGALASDALDWSTWSAEVTLAEGENTITVVATDNTGLTTTRTRHVFLEEVSGEMVEGIDVSHHQGDIVWSEVYNPDCRFAFAKATGATGYIDPEFEGNMIEGRNAGMLMGAYHFAYPEYNDPVDEAQFFVSVAGEYLGEGYLRPVLDMEDDLTENSYPHRLGKEALSNWIHEFMSTVESETGAQPILYINRNYAKNCLDESIVKYDLWIAKPEGLEEPPTPEECGIWDDWDFWQYSWEGSVPGISGNVDMDIFNGNMSMLQDNFVIEQPLSAYIKVDKMEVWSGDEVTFDGSASIGQIVSYKWDFDDGTIVEGSGKPDKVSHRFRGAMGNLKDYTVKLTVEDDKGATSINTASITVYPLKRYIPIYSSLAPDLPPSVATTPIIEIAVYYNWVDEIGGQDEYIISEVQLDSELSLSFAVYTFFIQDDGSEIWSKGHIGAGKEDVAFTYPFNVPRDSTKTIGDEHFEGLKVGPDSSLNFVVDGVELGIDIIPSFFRVSRTIEFGPGKQTEIPSIYPEGNMAGITSALGSPAELRMYDSQGNVTGLVNGTVKEEIPNSIYDEESEIIVIFFPEDINSYSYRVAGTDEGTYGLDISAVEDGEAETFVVTNISTTNETTHQYDINWSTLSQGVNMSIDADGDGTFEKNIGTSLDLGHKKSIRKIQ